MSNNSAEEMFHVLFCISGGENWLVQQQGSSEVDMETLELGAPSFPTGFPTSLWDAAWRGSPRAWPLLPFPQVLQYHRDPPSPPPGCREEEDVTQELHVLPALES